MIIKKRSNEYKYMGLELLYNRLPEEHAMKTVINTNLLSAKAGNIGERIVEDIFGKYQFPFNYRVLHDVSLISNGKFQLDTLFISPYYVVIFESKNIVGELSFETEPYCLIRKLENGKKDIYESPEVQVDRNKYLLGEWLIERGIDIPVMGVIVLSNRNSKVVKPPMQTPLIYATSIPVYLRNLQRQKEFLTVTQISDIAQKILKEHRTYFPYPMCENWRINPSDLITGVKCKSCDRFGMEKLKIGWHCSACGNIDRWAHESAIRDWFTLISNSLTNRECRQFLHINSYQTSLRIIERMKLEKYGENNKTIYKWNWVNDSKSDGYE